MRPGFTNILYEKVTNLNTLASKFFRVNKTDTYAFLSGFFPVTEIFDFGLKADTSKYGE